MANATSANAAIFATNELFSAMWILSRTMLAAGWKYKASSDALAKDTTGDMTNDRWATGGAVNNTAVSGQNGSAASIGAPSSGVSQITGLTGMATSSVGRFLTISGAATAANNGTWRIVSRTSATQVGIYNPAAASDANNAAIVWSEQQGGQAASISAAVNGRSTLTGLTGMVVPTSVSRGSVGDRVTITNATTGANNGTFLVTSVISATSVTIDNPAAVSDANNGSISWTEMSPLSQSYPTSLQGATGTGAWLDLQGPSTVRVPIGFTVPSGYIRGENLTQASTGAQGELIGSCTDLVGGLGYIVIAPRVTGTGSGPRGWNVSNGVTDNIVGGASGVTFSVLSTGTIVEFVQEMVMWKNTANNGHVYFQCVDSVAESTSRFSVQSALAGCTATVCPGGASTGVVTTNGFPSIGTFAAVGTGGTGVASTGSANFSLNQLTSNYGKVQAMCANAIEASGVSADGSFTIAVGNPGTGLNVYIGAAYQRLDDCEEGDVWPYMAAWFPSSSNYSGTRTANTLTAATSDVWSSALLLAASGYTPYRGWRRRGFSTGDAFQEFQGALLGSWNTASVIGANSGSADRVACAIANVVVREPLWVVSTQSGSKMRKGTCRWIHVTQGGSCNDTYDSKRWVQLSSTVSGAAATGPWDGTSIPQNS